MANDPLQNVSKNDPLTISADTHNAWNEAARFARRHKHDGGAGDLADFITPTLEVIVRNDTGADLDAGDVLKVTDWIVSPVSLPFEVRERPTVSGDTPDASTNLIVVLSEPIREDGFGRGAIAGVAVCDVLVNDSGHTYANPISGDSTRLGSASSGVARIVKWETSGSTRRAIVLIGDGQATATEIRGLTFTSDTDSTADSDPGAGLFKWDNATQSSATTIYFDDVTTDTRDVSDLFGDLAGPGSGGSGTGLGYIYLQQSDDSTRWQLWKWTAITAATGYTKFTVVHIASTVTIGKPIEDGKTVYALFSGEADASVDNGGRINESTQRLGNGRKDVEALSIDGVGKLFFESTALYPSGVISLADVAGTGDVKLGFRFGGVLSFASNDEADEYTIDGSGNGLLDFTTTSGGGPEHPLNLYSSDVLGGTGFTGPGITSPAIHTSGGYHIDIAGVSTAGATGSNLVTVSAAGGIITSGSASANFTDSVALSGDISPAQLTADTDDWNPTGW